MLSKKELSSLEEKFGLIAKAQDIELAEVQADAEKMLALVEKAPSAADKSREFILSRMLAALDALYTNKKRKGENVVFIVFGPLGEPKDWNAGEINDIEVSIARGELRRLMKEGKIITMEKNGEQVPVSKIITSAVKKKWIKDDKIYETNIEGSTEINELHIIEGEEWVKGNGLPLFRDHRLYNNNNVNFNYSHILTRNYNLQIVGIGKTKSSEEDWRLIKFSVRLDQADESSENFFFKKYEAFTPYVAQFEISEKSTPWEFILNASRITPKPFDMDMSEFDISLEKFLDGIHNKYEAECKNFLPYYLDGLINLEFYHNKTIKVNSQGEKEKTKSGYDATRFDSYAILCCHVSGISEPGAKGTRLYLADSTAERKLGAWVGKYIYHPPVGLPYKCLMMIKTSRGTNRYDWASHTSVYDPEHADINVTVSTIARLPGTVDIPDIEID